MFCILVLQQCLHSVETSTANLAKEWLNSNSRYCIARNKRKRKKRYSTDIRKESIKIKVWFVEGKNQSCSRCDTHLSNFFPHLTKKCDKITQFSLSWIKNRRNCHRFLKFLIHFCILFLLAKRKICMGYYILNIWKLPSEKTEYSSFVSGSSMGNRDNIVFFYLEQFFVSHI